MSIQLVQETSMPDIERAKFDVVLKQHTIQLKLYPCDCGVRAQWVCEVPIKTILPEELTAIMPDTKKTMTRVLDEWHWKPKWWQKLLRRQMHNELKKWIRSSRQEWIRLQASEKDLDNIWGKL